MALDLSGLIGVKTAANSPSSETKQTEGQLGQNQFLTLMLAQMKNQDPMKPMDPSQFTSQLAQFSTVTGIENMNASMTRLSESMMSSQVLSGTSLVGRDVLAAGNTATLSTGGTITGAVEIPDIADGVQVRVLNANGQLVRSFPIDPKTGFANFTWDGLANDGTAAPAGAYKIEVMASIGQEQGALDPMIASRVTSVTIDSSTHALTLNTNNGAFALSTVRRIQ